MVSIDALDAPCDYTSDSTNYYLTITVHISTHTVNISLGALSSGGADQNVENSPLGSL